jgi:hypothetical protein
MAQQSPVPAGQHGREPPAVGADAKVAHGEDAAMETMEPARSNPAVDHPRRQADRPELRPGHDSVLPARELGDGVVRGHARTLASRSAPRTRRWCRDRGGIGTRLNRVPGATAWVADRTQLR